MGPRTWTARSLTINSLGVWLSRGPHRAAAERGAAPPPAGGWPRAGRRARRRGGAIEPARHGRATPPSASSTSTSTSSSASCTSVSTRRRRRMIGPLPRGRGVLGELIRNPRPLRLADVTRTSARTASPRASSDEDVPRCADQHPRRGVRQPLPDRQGGGAEFDERDEESAVVLSEWAAIAIDNARLYEDPRRAGASSSSERSAASRRRPRSPARSASRRTWTGCSS